MGEFRRIRDFNLLSCRRCHAIVSPEDQDGHLHWHLALAERLRMATWHPTNPQPEVEA